MIDQVTRPGKELFSPAESIGRTIARLMREDQHFYLFSPDETTSNKVDAVFDVSSRAWDLPKESWDLPEETSGRIIELLSENTLFACMIGHIMNGEPAMMTSYEAFFSIITSQILQHLKFLEQASAVSWRPDYPAVNLLSTSTCWRQDHNGFSHQSPALISTLLSLPGNRANCLFPVDDVASEASIIFANQSRNVVNLITFNKNELPRWIDSHQADQQLAASGVTVFGFASDDDENLISTAENNLANREVAQIKGEAPIEDATKPVKSATEPDYVFVGIGDIVSGECLAAIDILHEDLPELRLRFVNIAALSYNAIGPRDNQLSKRAFDKYFTASKPLIVNFHGYPATAEQILSQYATKARLHVHGFNDHGSTTTPFEMLSVNSASRYHLAMDVAKEAGRPDLVRKYEKIIAENHQYAKEHGIDMF